jgi:hypothetical protein
MCANDSHTHTHSSAARSRHTRHKAIAVLSCSHVFHDRCMHSFELYNKEDTPLCPMCRAPYEKKVLRAW